MQNNNSPATAFQYFKYGQSGCWRVGGDWNSLPQSSVFNFIFDQYTPTRNYAMGVALHLTGGDTCKRPDGSVVQRALTLRMECTEMSGILSFANVTAVEEPPCDYNIVVRTPNACPTQCTRASNGVPCGGHGVCGYDTTTKSAHCYCNEGYTGSDCSTQQSGPPSLPTPPTDGGAIAGALFGGIFAGLIIFGGVYYYYVHVRKPSAAGGSYSAAASGSSVPGLDSGYRAPTAPGAGGGYDDENPLL